MATKEDLTHVAPLVKNTLLSQLANARTAMGLTQAELASRAGVSRMTIQRTEAEDADTSLSTFVLLALALNHTPRLVAKSDDDDKDQYTPLPAGIVHRGYAFNRTKSDLEYRDRQREAALAQEWEAANQDRLGLPPLMQTLVPNHTQEQ
ncbi:helix-turn-helix domain-containing protein, partial [Variovorax sp. WDL1]